MAKLLKRKQLKASRPNAGLEARYRARLAGLVERMARSVEHWLGAAYKANQPLAQDAKRVPLPALALRKAVRELAKRWQEKFDELAPRLADYFAQAAEERSTKALHDMLKEGGFTVKFTMTPAQRDVIEGVVAENVSLIKSIPQQYFTQVEGSVMRSVTTGRDLKQLTDDLQKHYGVTRRRAIFIARDQNNKATAALTRARQVESGLLTAKWRHSGAGKHPRPTHVAMNGKLYDVRKGMYDKAAGKWVLPGELPNCRCQSITMVEGFS